MLWKTSSNHTTVNYTFQELDYFPAGKKHRNFITLEIL